MAFFFTSAVLQASKSPSPDIHCSKAWGILLSVIWIWNDPLDFKGYILPLSVQSKNSGESAICIQKGSLTGNLLDNRKEGELGDPVSQTKPSQCSGLYGNKGAFSVQLSVRQEENEKYFLDGEPKCEAISCYFRYHTSCYMKCTYRRCKAFS